jgi:hypothetical protein
LQFQISASTIGKVDEAGAVVTLLDDFNGPDSGGLA